MKIAVAAPSHLPAQRANTIQVMKMCAALAYLGYETRLAAPGLPGQPVMWEELSLFYGVAQQFPVEWLPAHSRLKRYDYGWRAVHWARSWGADLFYTRLPQAAALSSLSGLPTLLEIHDLSQGWIGPLLLRLFLRGRGARRLAVITHALAVDVQARYHLPASPGFVCIAPDGVDLERYQELPEPHAARQALAAAGRLQLQTHTFTAGYTGSLYAGRGAELILELARLLPHTQFLLAGGESLDVEQLRMIADREGLQNLYLAGFIPNQDLPLYQAACDALLMPYQEHVAASSGGDIAPYLSPMKMFEYLACGRPILSSDLPVLQEILDPATAIILPSGAAGAWAQALQFLQAEPQAAAELGSRARAQAVRYSWQGRARRLLAGLVK
jgi:glycosyltransferase involved in cell wall biosynthesis